MKPLLAVALLIVLLAASSTVFARDRDDPQAPVQPDVIVEVP
jgi:hypothetical protein